MTQRDDRIPEGSPESPACRKITDGNGEWCRTCGEAWAVQDCDLTIARMLEMRADR